MPTIPALGALIGEFIHLADLELADRSWTVRALGHERDHAEALYAMGVPQPDVEFGLRAFKVEIDDWHYYNASPFTTLRQRVPLTKIQRALTAMRPARPSPSDIMVASEQLGYTDIAQLGRKAAERSLPMPRLIFLSGNPLQCAQK